jgi:hypothetical protein
LVVAGEAGIGKSRLVAAAMETAVAQQGTVLTGWCLSLSEDLPFLPMVDVLRALAERDEGRLLKSVFAACPGYVRHEIGRLLPEVDDSDHEPALTEEGVAGGDSGCSLPCGLCWPPSVSDAQRTGDRGRALGRPGHPGPAGVSARAVASAGVPMVLISRGEESTWPAGFLRHRHLQWLTVQPLTRRDGGPDQLLGGTASPEVVGDIFSRSQGNPFFTEQLVAAGGRPAVLPATLHALLLQRLAQVTDAGGDVVTALAVAGRPLGESALCSLTGRPAGRSSTRCVTQTPVCTGRGGDRQLRRVLAEAVRGDMTATEQRTAPGVAKHLAALNDSVAGEVAEHFAAAGVRSRSCARPSAEHADAVYAPAQQGSSGGGSSRCGRRRPAGGPGRNDLAGVYFARRPRWRTPATGPPQRWSSARHWAGCRGRRRCDQGTAVLPGRLLAEH